MMRDLRGLGWVILLSGVVFVPPALAASRITSIDFRGTENPNQIEIHSDGPIDFERQDNPQDRQIILSIKNAQISKGAARKIDTSSFKGNVTLISPYQVDGQTDTVRVVVQLREPGTADVVASGNTLKISVPTDVLATDIQTGEQTPMATPGSTTAVAPKTNLDEFMENKGTKRFNGKPVSIHVRDVDAADVFRLIGEASGFNIILGEDVKGNVTLSLTDVPWDQALDVLLHTLRLGAERRDNILRIVTLKSLKEEKQAEYDAVKATELSAPRVTRIFSISYANIDDLQKTLKNFASSSATGGAGSAGDSAIDVDKRTNSIVVRDTAENVEKMKKLIELLDTQTPQVMIEGKVVEATDSFQKKMDGMLGISALNGGDISAFGSFNTADLNALSGSATASQSGAGKIGLSPNVSFIPGVQQVNAFLTLSESESLIKVVSSPKLVVLNKNKATISQGTPVVSISRSVTGSTETFSTTTKEAIIALEVTPTVTNEGSVLLDMILTRDLPMKAAGSQEYQVAPRKIQTQVLVDSGSTLVIGGMYQMRSENSSGGFPFLRKLPILGALFSSDSDATERTELFMFITPRILNVKESGLSNG